MGTTGEITLGKAGITEKEGGSWAWKVDSPGNAGEIIWTCD